MAWQNRVSFYKIPFSRTGVTYPLPTIGGIYADLESYKIDEIITEKPFNENQTRITTAAMTDALLACNYIRVGRVNPDAETPAGANDTNVSYFWCMDCYRLGSSNGEDGNMPGVFEIEPDDVMTEFFEGSAAEVAGRKVAGRLNRTSKKLSNYALLTGFIPNKEQNIEIKQANSLKSTTPWFYIGYTILAIATAETGTIYGIGRRGFNALSLNRSIRDFANISSLHVSTNAINCTLTGIWVINDDLIDESVLPSSNATIMDYRSEDGSTKQLKVALFGDSTIGTTGQPQAPIFKKIIFHDETEIIDENKKLYIVTPKRFLEYPYKNNKDIEVSISIQGGNGGRWIDQPAILMYFNGDFIDVSDDFSVSFAVNAAAVERSQFSSLYTLRQISTAIGAIGGAVGGFASGNYFGALQSITGGISSIFDTAAQTKKPADIKTSSNGYAYINYLLGGVGYVELSPDPTYINYTEQYGYNIDNQLYIEIYANTLTEDFYQFASCEVPEVAGGGQNAHATIETMFLRGVRFKAL